MFLLVIPLAFGNYAVSSPTKVIVEKGGYGKFDFQIQAYNSEEDLICSYDIGDTSPFNIIFDGFEVNKKSAIVVNGIVNAPKKIETKSYSYDFCVSCSPKSSIEGASTNIRFCGIKINIGIVEPKKEMRAPKGTVIVGLIILIGFIVLLVVFLKKRKVFK